MPAAFAMQTAMPTAMSTTSSYDPYAYLPTPTITTSAELSGYFSTYLEALNTNPDSMLRFLNEEVEFNGKTHTRDEIVSLVHPGSTFSLRAMVVDPVAREAAVRMTIVVPAPSEAGLGLDMSDDLAPGSIYEEHVFYKFDKNWLINDVWSVYTFRNKVHRHERPRRRRVSSANLPQDTPETALPTPVDRFAEPPAAPSLFGDLDPNDLDKLEQFYMHRLEHKSRDSATLNKPMTSF